MVSQGYDQLWSVRGLGLCTSDKDGEGLLEHASGSTPTCGPREIRGWRFSRKVLVAATVGVCCLFGALVCGLVAERRPARLDGISQEVALAWTPPTETTTTTYTTTHPFGPSPTLFCWSHMQPNTSEVPLLRLQLARRANIFSCNYAAVISTKKILLGNMDGVEVWTWVNEAKEVPMGTNGVDGSTTDSFLNTEIFLIGWETLMYSQQIWPYDFVVKVDPDSVFFPERLRDHVSAYVGKKVYFSNCGKWGGQVLLYGSLEVFSIGAMRSYEQHVKDCRALPWHGWGEDYYMQHCMDMMGVENVPDTNQVGDDRCVAAECWDLSRVAFHDFKTAAEWDECYKTATGIP